jgi:hypothetical protein
MVSCLKDFCMLDLVWIVLPRRRLVVQSECNLCGRIELLNVRSKLQRTCGLSISTSLPRHRTLDDLSMHLPVPRLWHDMGRRGV